MDNNEQQENTEQDQFTQQDQNAWQSEQNELQNAWQSEQNSLQNAWASEQNQQQNAWQSEQNQQQLSWQSRENAKARAQNFLVESMNKKGSFSGGQDYTGGAASIGRDSFNPNGKKGIGSAINEKYAFKSPN